MIYSINVLIITYKQQDVIGRAIESALIQRNYGLNKIIIADDCSPDNTWGVLSQYEKQYPDIIEIYRNEINLGIYENLQKLITRRGKADFYYKLSGDDVLCDGWFKVVQKNLNNTFLDLSKPIGIFSDWVSVLPNGNEHLYSASDIERKLPLISLYIRERGFGSGRSLLINDNVISQYEPLVLGHGLNLTESCFDSQDFRFIQNVFYIPYTASVYYGGRGVSLELFGNKSDYFTTQAIYKWNYFINNYLEIKEDIWYAKYGIEKAKYYKKPSIACLFRILCYYHRGKLKELDYDANDYWKIAKPLLRYGAAKFIKKVLGRS